LGLAEAGRHVFQGLSHPLHFTAKDRAHAIARRSASACDIHRLFIALFDKNIRGIFLTLQLKAENAGIISFATKICSIDENCFQGVERNFEIPRLNHCIEVF
jgi:hypothetical protein